jgi:hypothetical protein
MIVESNADNPSLIPLIYDPSAPAGRRFKQVESATTTVPRMYHSTASLTPDGIVVLGIDFIAMSAVKDTDS